MDLNLPPALQAAVWAVLTGAGLFRACLSAADWWKDGQPRPTGDSPVSLQRLAALEALPGLLAAAGMVWLSALLLPGIARPAFWVLASGWAVGAVFEGLSVFAPQGDAPPPPRARRLRIALQSVTAGLIVTWCVYATTRPFLTQPLVVSAPLTGEWRVAQAGKTRWTNAHHGQPPSQNYAVDFEPAVGIGDRRVFSPVFGRVAHAEGHWLGGEGPPEGNHVVNSTPAGVMVWLAHLAPSSVTVAAGDHVDPGDRLGEVGSTGSATRPHLHIHGERIGTGDAIPLLFEPGRRWVVRADRVRFP